MTLISAACGNCKILSDASTETKLEYNSSGQLVKSWFRFSPNNATSVYQYNEKGLVTKQSMKDDKNNQVISTTDFFYDNNDRVFSKKFGDEETKIDYDNRKSIGKTFRLPRNLNNIFSLLNFFFPTVNNVVKMNYSTLGKIIYEYEYNYEGYPALLKKTEGDKISTLKLLYSSDVGENNLTKYFVDGYNISQIKRKL